MGSNTTGSQERKEKAPRSSSGEAALGVIKEEQAPARLLTYGISKTRMLSFVIPTFQMRKWRQRGSGSTVSPPKPRKSSLSHSLPVTLLCPVTPMSLLSVTLACDARFRLPTSNLSHGSWYTCSELCPVIIPCHTVAEYGSSSGNASE